MSTKGKRIRNTARLLSELFFLVLFVYLVINKTLQSWMLVFGGAIFVSIVFGRFYCSWACPMGTVFRGIDFIYRKLKINRLKTPSFFQDSWLRWLILAGFVGSFIAFRVFKIRINVLLYVSAFAVLITLFFDEEFWHRHLCPYGTLLHIFAKISIFKIKISPDKCAGCGKCETVCPNNSIYTDNFNKRKINSEECLNCFQCQDICPTDAIKYTKGNIT